MTETTAAQLSNCINRYQGELVNEWLRILGETGNVDTGLRQLCGQFLAPFTQALQNGSNQTVDGHEWDETRKLLAEFSRLRARQGFTPTQTALFVFSLKQPIFSLLRREFSEQPNLLADGTWMSNTTLDKLGLYTVEIYQESRDQIISRQQQELLELSTPVVKLWQNILALPLIGTLDSSRTQIVMESLLQKIVETGAAIAIIDITGVPTVDTLVAQHLLKTVAAARLMGADCIISGIRPQIAQTIVHLGVDLEDVTTKATLADAFVVALQRTGAALTPAKV